ncbi:prolyl oligopeptidase family serine peptidase [Xanthobacter autotrophicus]|uniref:extracellular catalytic domain type 1 short-chain-length polyhydroxyalkanoate depolymerase n=1 Tax=Xanthobacter TaxID=279 RepID=UPI0024AA4517|nr:PHB depolymerase family esterase [Xanthobacter autotrophicus]MDI4666797.1 prolyl oligopeptidase family serine peptidase [Xanthobacter autotrophicus]
MRDLRLAVNGEDRRYLVVTPDGVTGPAPVVVALHGAAQTPESFRAYFGLDAAAAAHGLVAVYPEGEGRVWNDGRPAAMRLKMMLRPGDDVAFLVALARRLAEDGIADPARIYLTGISNGGFMVQRMACEHAELFAAYSSIMATAPANYREECKPDRPIPIQFIHGTADSVIAYAGFWTPVGATLSAPESARLFARINGCGASTQRALPDLDQTDGTTAVQRRWEACRDGAAVELISIDLGGHQPPARVDTKPDLATPFLGLRSRDIDSGEEVWRFMSAFGGAGSPQAGAGAVPLPPPSPLRGNRAGAVVRPAAAVDQRGISTQ